MTFLDLLIRLGAAALCGGLIGIERGKKRRAAGFRTYMLVCMGAALTMVLGIYLKDMILIWRLNDGLEEPLHRTDIARFGAQVINGIGFIGAGTIIVTGRQQVKGMTTAAGLWASACMGLAIGAGFYSAAVIACLLIIVTIVVFSKLEVFIVSHVRNVNFYIEFESIDGLSAIIEKIKSEEVRIFDVEITKPKPSEDIHYPQAIFTLRLPKKKTHMAFMTALAQVETVRSIEEL